MEGTKRSDIKTGMLVQVVLKQDQHSGKLTAGIVQKILTKSPNHPHGIKVLLHNRMVGRVKKIEDKSLADDEA
ncbi:MAG: YwbE family protein [Bacteroidales bacterium]|nr:YwbE family protein [Bacteroidales bacterium]MCF8405143.1 YwbE family protein [Bacteroidales bacterium]